MKISIFLIAILCVFLSLSSAVATTCDVQLEAVTQSPLGKIEWDVQSHLGYPFMEPLEQQVAYFDRVKAFLIAAKASGKLVIGSYYKSIQRRNGDLRVANDTFIGSVEDIQYDETGFKFLLLRHTINTGGDYIDQKEWVEFDLPDIFVGDDHRTGPQGIFQVVELERAISPRWFSETVTSSQIRKYSNPERFVHQMLVSEMDRVPYSGDYAPRWIPANGNMTGQLTVSGGGGLIYNYMPPSRVAIVQVHPSRVVVYRLVP